MTRVRIAAHAALMVVLLLAATAWFPLPRSAQTVLAAAVTWPPSTGLVVLEVVTGGASASDEWIEIANAGPSAVDLAGMTFEAVAAFLSQLASADATRVEVR